MSESPQTKQIFLDALDEPPPGRAAFVGRACGDDAALRDRVLALLASHDSAGGILDAPPVLDPALLDDLSHPMANARIGGYRLVRVLGRGGCGVVWLAEQREPIRRQVALKLLHPSLIGFGAHPSSARQVIARFEAERQALAVMDHPHIARVIEAGTVREGPHAGQPFFAMEYVDGLPITRYCAQHGLGLSERLGLFMRVCLAVQHAHQKGLIHRDLKPGNILVCTTDAGPMPKVIDFGVAKAIGGAAGASHGLTQQSQFIGTPQYMAPEQARAGLAEVDTRSDVYALGAVLYELLAGTPPLDAETLRGGSSAAWSRVVEAHTPVLPSTRLAAGDAARGNPPAARVRGELDWIVMKALEKEPQRRYQSPAELARDVERHLRDEAVSAGPPSRVYRARKFVRRHRLGVVAGLAIAGSLVTATAVSMVQTSRARAAGAAATAQADLARRELAKFEALARFNQLLLRSITPSVARGRDVTLMGEVLEHASVRAATDLAAQPEAAAAIHSMLGFAHGSLGDATRAIEHYGQARSLARQAYGPDDPETLREAGNYYAALNDAGRYDEADRVAGELSAAFERAGQTGSGDAMAFYSNVGASLLKRERVDEAMAWFERAMVRVREVGDTDPETYPSQSNLAVAHFKAGRVTEAGAVWTRLLERQRQRLGPDHPQTLSTLGNLAEVAEQTGDHATAERLLRETAAGKRKVLPPVHPSRILTELSLAEFYLARGRPAEAVAVLESVDADCARLLPADDAQRQEVAAQLADARRRVEASVESR